MHIRLLALSALTSFAAYSSAWVVAPTAYTNIFGPEGPDGTPGTSDDLQSNQIGSISGYRDGQFVSAVSGLTVTYHVELQTIVTDPYGSIHRHFNFRTVNYGQASGLVPFTTVNNPFHFVNPMGTAGPDEIPGNADDLPVQTFDDPFWGWNVFLDNWGSNEFYGANGPLTTGTVAQTYMFQRLAPEPASMVALGLGLAGVLRTRRR